MQIIVQFGMTEGYEQILLYGDWITTTAIYTQTIGFFSETIDTMQAFHAASWCISHILAK